VTEHLLETASEGALTEPTPTEAEPKRLTRRQLIMRRFVRNKTAVTGLVIIVALIIIALIGPYLTNWTYDYVDRRSYPSPRPNDTGWVPPRAAGTCWH
jgi:peptide/nickel transport system permease protein